MLSRRAFLAGSCMAGIAIVLRPSLAFAAVSTARITVDPTTAKRGAVCDVDAWCLDARSYDLEVVDAAGRVTMNHRERPLKDGSFRTGITAPTLIGTAIVSIRPSTKGSAIVASVPLQVVA